MKWTEKKAEGVCVHPFYMVNMYANMEFIWLDKCTSFGFVYINVRVF